MRSPVQPRGGFTAFPNERLALALGALPGDPLRLLVGLMLEAEFKLEGSTTPDGRWCVGFGQVLVSYSGLAERYGMTVDAVRWAFRLFANLGITVKPAARPNETPDQHTLPATKRHTNRPNVVDLGEWAAFLGEGAANTKRNTSRDTSESASRHATIQHGNTRTRSSLRSEGAPRAADEDRPPPRQVEILDLTVGKPPLPDPGQSPFERIVAHWFAAWERAGRGKYSRLTDAEGAQLKRLLREFDPGELVARMDRAFADAWFVEHGDLMAFVRQQNRFAPAGRRNTRAAAPTPLPDPGCPEWGRLRAAVQGRVRPEPFAKFHADLVGRMDGSVLVLVAPDAYRRDFLVDNHRAFLAQVAREIGLAEDVRIEARAEPLVAGGAP